MPQAAQIHVQVDGCNYGVEDVEMPAPGGHNGATVKLKSVNIVVPRSPDAESGAGLIINLLFTREALEEFTRTMQGGTITVASPTDLRRLLPPGMG
jgi:hypothetical protein